MRFKAAFSAALLALLLAGCRPILVPVEDPLPASAATAPASEASVPTGVWTGDYPGSGDWSDTLAPELYLPIPYSAPALVLEIDAAGRCLLRSDFTACAASLREPLTDFLRTLWAKEGAPFPGADPGEIAAALLDERLPPPLRLTGMLAPDGGEIRWDDGGSAPLLFDGEALTLSVPALGAPTLLRSGSETPTHR